LSIIFIDFEQFWKLAILDLDSNLKRQKSKFWKGVWNLWQERSQNCSSMKWMKLNKTRWNFFVAFVYYCWVPLTTVGNHIRLYLSLLCIVKFSYIVCSFHTKFIQNLLWVGIKAENSIFLSQNASWLNFIHCRSFKMA
jgi:hypothetical protein